MHWESLFLLCPVLGTWTPRDKIRQWESRGPVFPQWARSILRNRQGSSQGRCWQMYQGGAPQSTKPGTNWIRPFIMKEQGWAISCLTLPGGAHLKDVYGQSEKTAKHIGWRTIVARCHTPYAEQHTNRTPLAVFTRVRCVASGSLTVLLVFYPALHRATTLNSYA